MDTQQIEDMILILENSEATELEVQCVHSLVRIVKAHRPKPKKAAQSKQAAEAPQAEPQKTEHTYEYITAPMVGIFHVGESGLQIGSEIAVGQNVGVIESMKLHNELHSRIDGVVSEVLVEDATPVEYGQPLFRVSPTTQE